MDNVQPSGSRADNPMDDPDYRMQRMDWVPRRTPEIDPVESEYAASESGASEEAEDEKEPSPSAVAATPASTPAPAGPEVAAGPEPAAEANPAETTRPAAKKRRFPYRREVRDAGKRHMPSLRNQRKYKDEEGNSLSRLQVNCQMQGNVLTPYEKEEWHSKDFAEDEHADFERVRMMFIDDKEAQKYFGSEYSNIALKGIVQSVESKRLKLSLDDGQSELGQEGVHEANGSGEESDSSTKYDYREIGEGKKLKTRRMPKKLYIPEPMKEGTKKAIKDAIRTPPRYLYRASSRISGAKGKKTNGYDSLTVHKPAADLNNDEHCHASMYDIPNGIGEFSEMLGRRFLWHDRRRDEMLSWTSSLLFALVHATGRLAKGQKEIVIHVIDTTKVTTPDGRPVDFHFAPDLLRLLDIKGWYGWPPFERKNLQQPWYTHEWITHGVVKSPEAFSMEANIDELISKGLYTLLKHLQTPEDDDMRSLYHRCGYTRSKYHRKDGKKTPVTWDEFTLAKRLSRCFVAMQVTRRDPYCIPPLNLVIDFLAIKARPYRGEDFTNWIRSNYSQADLTSIAYERSTRIANNLPEQAQTLLLSCDACVALGLSETPGTRVWMADQNFDWYGKWLKDAAREIKIRKTGKDAGAGLLKKEMLKTIEAAEERRRQIESGDRREGGGVGATSGEGPMLDNALPGQGAESAGTKTGDSTQGRRSGSNAASLLGYARNKKEEEAQVQQAIAASLRPELPVVEQVGEGEEDIEMQMALAASL